VKTMAKAVMNVMCALLLAVALLLGGYQSAGGVKGAYAQATIASVASSVEDLSILVEAIVEAGLIDAVAEEEAEFTVFAPTNEAFLSLLDGLGFEGLADIPTDLLEEVLLYHIVPAVAFSSDLSNGQVLPTLNGAELVVDLTDGVVIDGVGSDATVIEPNVEAGNSVVHVVDTVLLPFVVGADGPVEDEAPMAEPMDDSESIASVASGVTDLSVLVEAIVAAGLIDFVADPEAEVTVFAPTNEAFVALLSSQGFDGLNQLPIDFVRDILLYHVVPVVAYSTDLSDGQVLPTLNGAELVVDLTDGVVIDGIGSDATVIAADIEAGMSVVHLIDAVLLPVAL